MDGLLWHKPPSEELRAPDFFEEVLPEILQLRSSSKRLVPGRLMFDVDDAGTWLVDPAKGLVTSATGHEPCEVAVRTTAQDLEGLLSGKRSGEELLASGALRLAGNPDVLRSFGLLIQTR